MQFSKEITGKKAVVNIYCDSFNERIRVDSYSGKLEEVNQIIDKAANASAVEKVIVKSQTEHLHAFLEKGYELEAFIKGYFHGSDAYFLAKFLTVERKLSSEWEKSNKILGEVQQLKPEEKHPLYSYNLQKAGKGDAERLAGLYEKVFPVYPVPMQDPEYVQKSIEGGTVFLFVEKSGEIISAASAEIDQGLRCAELTDCATLPAFRGGGLMKQLLAGLEEELEKQHIYCAYTIARSLSYGMNAAFKQLGYRYGGRLVNNCYIFDKMEDMNIWWKDLSDG
ncbi:putative beta-lysine N-acetyltransferase [Rossellomorea vietnamensis]|uniref:Putative beta-lysine N-acetyltransferase n=1 Tax=Rossellomorea vietnamensis TaxID=218284 RepID=A0A5D4MIG6_9BACI|nr:putative beta-lysine N-acetyltransferase [Rossellomorea vietnamensis]TYS01620.1 putative beta-lysine N-acetyltransferase [Rossellomorea vietnamensis]